MGTYTANYQLYMPSIGEQGWGDLMNGNLTTIDTTMKGLNTRMGTAETEIDAIEEKVTALEPLSVIQVDENQNVTFPAGVNISGAINGTVIKSSGIITFTPIEGEYLKIPLSYPVTFLSYRPGCTYTGTLKVKLDANRGSGVLKYFTGLNQSGGSQSVETNATEATLTFTNIPYLVLGVLNSTGGNVTVSAVSLS